MPLIRIDLVKGRTEAQVGAVADAIHGAVVDTLGIPGRDRFQLITEHERGHVIAQDAGLGFERSDGVVMVQVFTQAGRSTQTKQRLYAAIARSLSKVGVAGEDVFIGYVENTAADWSFGFGRAQYVDGDLEIPGSASTC
ncbi:tautomerase family protein [Wenjunlia tyrosinilytica]|uniref:4-oxalocrotonate tautomerase n=1 Tax=Wenjunlia tyrosinilytica TaxID=1544741 RepID=A0A918E0H5_9ACTN|nr:tautomerase family protein [Wenjunlia tyrosinilytica]GGO94583.1 putative 4-oxalocrotonate tautomerase [Wenjunlia tyrosinilytica]